MPGKHKWWMKYQEGTPSVQTGIAPQGAARPYIDRYFAGTHPGFNLGVDTRATGQPLQNQWQQPVVPPIQTPIVDTTTHSRDTTGTTGLPGGGGSGGTGHGSGFGFGPSGGLGFGTTNAPGTLVNVPVPFQGVIRKGRSNEEHGFTTEDVIDARAKLDAGETLEGFNAPAGFEGGADRETQHANIDAVNAAYADAFSAIPKDGTATTEQRVAAAAANPAYNPDLAEKYGDIAIGVGNVGGAKSPLGITKKAKNVLTEDAERVLRQDISRDAADRGARQNAFGGATLNAAGIRNIGGSYAQDGDNQGLPSDYMVVGSSDGSSEVWGPDGKTYSSVEEAKADIPNNEKAKKIAELDNLARSGSASGTQVSQAAYKAGITGKDRARLTAQAMASERDSANDKRRAAEAREREAAEGNKAYEVLGPTGVSGLSADEAQAKYKEITGKTVDRKEATSALRNTFNKGQKVANEAIEDPNLKAIVTRDRGDLKTQLRAAGIKYKKDDSTSKLISKLESANPQLENQYIKDNYGRVVGAGAPPPPPVTPPPQPVAQAAPPPKPVAQAAPAPAPAPVPQPAQAHVDAAVQQGGITIAPLVSSMWADWFANQAK